MLALWVIAHHLTGPGMMLAPAESRLSAPLRNLVDGGYLAVQTFFVLSGFVLARSYANMRWDRQSVLRYLSARFGRIYPAYLLSLAIVSYFIGLYVQRPQPATGEKAFTLFEYAFLLQGWRRGGGPGWNTPAWSLSCEIFFYLFLPALLPAIWRAGSRALALTVAASCAAAIVLTDAGAPHYWKPIQHFADFTMGIAASRIYGGFEIGFEARRTAPAIAALLYVPAIAFGAALIAWPRLLEGTYVDLNTALRPLNALALIGIARGAGALPKILSARPIEYLGQTSYSMYILHVPLLWWYGNGGLKHLHLRWASAALVYAVAVIGAAVLSFEFVEKPANRRIRNWSERKFARRTDLRAAA